MPGYYVHLATINKKTQKNKNFIKGVEAPDLLKYYYKNYGLEEARKKYNTIKIDGMPSFSYFEDRIQQVENSKSDSGLHYGLSSNPNIEAFYNSLDNNQKNNPFYKGYLWHLLTDKIMYAYLDIESKLKRFTYLYKNDENLEKLRIQEINKLHSDWDKTNSKIRDRYTDIILPKEIEELNIVKFIDDDNLSYVDFDIIKLLIDYMRLFNPIEDDIIKIIMDLLPDNNKNLKEILKRKVLKR